MILATTGTAAPTFTQNPSEQSASQAAQARGDAAGARAEAAQARAEAAQARSEARDAAREANQGQEQNGSGAVITITKDGQSIVLDGASPEALARMGIQLPSPIVESDGPYVVGGLAIVSGALVMIVALTLWYRAKVRGTTQHAAIPADLMQRLARMENGIESVAVEVERISEGQRFTTRLLSDRAPQEVPRG